MAPLERSLHVAFVGCGFMSTALLEGLLRKPADPTRQALSYSARVRSAGSLERLERDLAKYETSVDTAAGHLVEAIETADVIVIGCQGQDLGVMLETEGFVARLKGRVVISLMAGVSTDQLLERLREADKGGEGAEFLVARIIPSLGCLIGRSVTLVASPLGMHQQEIVDRIMGQLGTVHYIPEALMDEATALGAACHAMMIVGIDTATDASVAEGIPRSTAAAIAAESFSSASSLMAGEMTAERLKTAMSTPSGITINSVVKLEEKGFRSAVAESTQHAIRYARQMS